MQFILNAIHLHEGIACFVKNVYFYGINRGIMRKKSAQFLTILILMMGGVCFSGCDKEGDITYPTVILTPENAEESVITGTIVSGRITQADEATFVNAQKETVWKKLTRKK